MTSGLRKPASKLIKAAAVAGAIGLVGFVMAPTSDASLLTLSAQPVSVTGSGSVINSPTSVTLGGVGSSVTFNLVGIIHGADQTAADNGMLTSDSSIVTDSGGSLGTLTFNGYNSQFNGSLQTPAPTGTPPGTDLGPDRVGSTNTSRGTTIAATSTSTFLVTGVGDGSGNLAETLASVTYTLTVAGTTTIQPVWHVDTITTSSGRTIKFNVAGHSYALNGDGTGFVDSTTSVSDPTALDTQGFTVTAAPEPGSLALAGLGGLGLLLRRRRK
jgi:hypothetical protein